MYKKIDATCSLIGIQAHRLDPDNLNFHRRMMGKLIERELRHAICDGVSIFRVGMHMGADIWAAQRIILLRDAQFPHIRLHCYLPCETQANNWPDIWREQYFDVLAQADWVFCPQSHYSRGCMQRQKQTMLIGSDRLIAIHDNVAEGGISQAVRYAEAREIETVVIRPLEGPDAPFDLRAEQTRHQSRSQVSSTYSGRFSTGKSAIKRAW